MRVRPVFTFVAVSLVLATAPAVAKPTKPPADPPVAVALTFAADGENGLAGDLMMRPEISRNGAIEYFADGTGSSSANLELRGFEPFQQGLHFGLIRLDPNECGQEPLYEGMFWLSFDRDGVLTSVMWHFDMDASFLAAHKKGCSWLVNERYTIRSLSNSELLPGETPLTFAAGMVSGTFSLHRYDADAAEPHVDLAREAMTFGLVLDG